MELVYKPSVQRLREDMKLIRELAQEIALLAASHDYPEIKTGTEVAKGTAKSHTDHPYRHFDRTCPACVGSVYEQVDLDAERRGD